MSLLALENVSKRYGRGSHERVALRNVSLEIAAGELVAIWGLRRSGRSTLMRIAAALETPDSGIVRYRERDLAERGADELRGHISYCRRTFRPAGGQLVIDQLTTSQLMRGLPSSLAQSRAREALAYMGAERCAALRPSELDGAEAIRVALARAWAHQPKLLIVDEPTLGVGFGERDLILTLLRTLTNDGVAVLMSVGETPCLSGSDRALSLDEGELHGELRSAELAQVLPLRPAAVRLARA